MPYASKAQQRFVHTPSAKRKGFPTKDFDRATKNYATLPERATSKKRPSARSMRGRR